MGGIAARQDLVLCYCQDNERRSVNNTAATPFNNNKITARQPSEVTPVCSWNTGGYKRYWWFVTITSCNPPAQTNCWASFKQSGGETLRTLKEMTVFSKEPVCGATRKISRSSNLVKILWCNHELTLVTHPVAFFPSFFFFLFSQQPSRQMWRKLAGEQKCGEPDESAGSSACV